MITIVPKELVDSVLVGIMFRYFHIAFLLLFNGFNISCGAAVLGHTQQ